MELSVSGWLCYANATSGNRGGSYTLNQLEYLSCPVKARFNFGLWLTKSDTRTNASALAIAQMSTSNTKSVLHGSNFASFLFYIKKFATKTNALLSKILNLITRMIF